MFKWQYNYILQRDGRECQYCGTTEAEQYQVDHIVPAVWGGQDVPSNLVIACRNCNNLKRSRVWTPTNLSQITAEQSDHAAAIIALTRLCKNASAVPYGAEAVTAYYNALGRVPTEDESAAEWDHVVDRNAYRLTVDLTVGLHRQFKALAARRNTTMREIIQEFVRQEVAAEK